MVILIMAIPGKRKISFLIPQYRRIAFPCYFALPLSHCFTEPVFKFIV